MLFFEQLKQLTINIPLLQKSVGFSMYKAECVNHKTISFEIPQSVDEASTFEAWEQIKAMENHLKKYPNCKMMRVKE